MLVVIKIGGSVLASPPNPELICRYAEVLGGLVAQGHKLLVTVGGGAPARDFIKIAKEMNLTEPEQDEIAISISRIFAQLLAIKMGGLEWGEIPKTLEEAEETVRARGIAIMGGLRPGMTTDTVAAMAAVELNADLIVKATDQEGIYTKDPRRHPDARKLDELSFDELAKTLERVEHEAGIHQILDPEAVKILKRNRIRTVVVNGFKPENITKAIRGEKIGTLIH